MDSILFFVLTFISLCPFRNFVSTIVAQFRPTKHTNFIIYLQLSLFSAIFRHFQLLSCILIRVYAMIDTTSEDVLRVTTSDTMYLEGGKENAIY
jgi:hypothetical protein